MIANKDHFIGEFMGWTITPKGRFEKYLEYIDDNGDHHVGNISHKEIQYTNSWNLLMSVIDKIEELGYDVNISHVGCSIVHENYTNFDISEFSDTKLKACLSAIIKFIIYYNTLKKP